MAMGGSTGFVEQKNFFHRETRDSSNAAPRASANKNDGSGINTPNSGNHSLKKQFSATGTFFNNNSHGAQTTNEQPIPMDSSLVDPSLQPQFIGQTNIDVKMLFKQN
jgi:hypothetical protein